MKNDLACVVADNVGPGICYLCGTQRNTAITDDNGRKLHLHRFPLNNRQREEWIYKIGKPELLNISHNQLKKNYRLCSKHFSKVHYRLCNDNTEKLKFNAVPDIGCPGALPSCDQNIIKLAESEQNVPVISDHHFLLPYPSDPQNPIFYDEYNFFVPVDYYSEVEVQEISKQLQVVDGSSVFTKSLRQLTDKDLDIPACKRPSSHLAKELPDSERFKTEELPKLLPARPKRLKKPARFSDYLTRPDSLTSHMKIEKEDVYSTNSLHSTTPFIDSKPSSLTPLPENDCEQTVVLPRVPPTARNKKTSVEYDKLLESKDIIKEKEVVLQSKRPHQSVCVISAKCSEFDETISREPTETCPESNPQCSDFNRDSCIVSTENIEDSISQDSSLLKLPEILAEESSEDSVLTPSDSSMDSEPKFPIHLLESNVTQCRDRHADTNGDLSDYDYREEASAVNIEILQKSHNLEVSEKTTKVKGINIKHVYDKEETISRPKRSLKRPARFSVDMELGDTVPEKLSFHPSNTQKIMSNGLETSENELIDKARKKHDLHKTTKLQNRNKRMASSDWAIEGGASEERQPVGKKLASVRKSNSASHKSNNVTKCDIRGKITKPGIDKTLKPHNRSEESRATTSHSSPLTLSGVSSDNKKLICEICYRLFSNLEFLEKHHRTQHSSVEKFSCPCCEFESVLSEVVNQHMTDNHYICGNQCLFFCNCLMQFENHLSLQHNMLYKDWQANRDKVFASKRIPSRQKKTKTMMAHKKVKSRPSVSSQHLRTSPKILASKEKVKHKSKKNMPPSGKTLPSKIKRKMKAANTSLQDNVKIFKSQQRINTVKKAIKMTLEKREKLTLKKRSNGGSQKAAKSCLTNVDVKVIKILKCDICLHVVNSRRALSMHKDAHHDIDPEASAAETHIASYKCPICSFERPSRQEVAVHVVTH